MAYNKQWEAINKKYKVLDRIAKEGFIKISAREISATQEDYPNIHFEPRLLAHFDYKAQQPQLFIDNHISILPLNRGNYVIGAFNPFMTVGKNKQSLDSIEIRKLKERKPLTTITASRPESFINETMGLNYAYAQGVIEDFIGEPLTATIAGRQRGGVWRYQIASKGNYLELEANNPQIEIDAGYEGNKNIVLVEAKNSLVSEFCLRQLYFPYRTWTQKTNKEVRSIFTTINSGEFFLYEYVYPDTNIFEAKCTRSVHYVIEEDTATKEELLQLINCKKIEENPLIPFPQANSILRTINLIELAIRNKEGITKQQIASQYNFNERQGDYYANSALYLGFLQKQGKVFVPTAKAFEYNNIAAKKDKNLFIAKSILEHKAFSKTLELALNAEEIPDVETITRILASNSNIESAQTIRRRASTVKNWITWLYNLI